MLGPGRGVFPLENAQQNTFLSLNQPFNVLKYFTSKVVQSLVFSLADQIKEPVRPVCLSTCPEFTVQVQISTEEGSGLNLQEIIKWFSFIQLLSASQLRWINS